MPAAIGILCNDLVGAGEQHRRHGDGEFGCGLEVDNKPISSAAVPDRTALTLEYTGCIELLPV